MPEKHLCWQSLWTSEKDDFALVTNGDPTAVSSVDELTIHNLRERLVVVITDPECASLVKQQMRNAGVRVLNIQDEAIKPNQIAEEADRLLEEGASIKGVNRFLKQKRHESRTSNP